MISAKRHVDPGRFLSVPLCWLFTFAILLQVVGAPTLTLRDGATIADPVRAAQLLCSQADANTPLNHHHKVPAPDTFQCLVNHSGFGVALIGSTLIGIPIPACCAKVFVGAAATLSFRPGFAAYTARAPPHFI
jgi:hypothetical protein